MRTIRTRRAFSVLALVVVAGGCGADHPVSPRVGSDALPSSMNSQQDTTGKTGVGTLGSGNREGPTQQGGVGTIGSGN